MKLNRTYFVIGLSLITVFGLAVYSNNQAQAAGTTYNVRQDGSGNFTTIQACANAANPGDTCLVFGNTENSPRLFNERINLDYVISFPPSKSLFFNS